MNKAMIVSLQPDAVEAGARVLMAGGNAVDAALACAFVQTVVDPLMCGIAGFGSMHVLMPGKGVHEIIDFHGRVPASATPQMWQDLILGEMDDGFGFVLKGAVNDLGYQSITTPGTLKAFHQAHGRWGSLPWATIMEPAIRSARDGFMVTPGVHGYWTSPDRPGRTTVLDRLRYSASGRAIYCTDAGQARGIGAVVKNPDYARSLAIIADKGSDVFYSGAMAATIDADMRAHGGLLTAGDLAAYETETAAPCGAATGVSTWRPTGRRAAASCWSRCSTSWSAST